MHPAVLHWLPAIGVDGGGGDDSGGNTQGSKNKNSARSDALVVGSTEVVAVSDVVTGGASEELPKTLGVAFGGVVVDVSVVGSTEVVVVSDVVTGGASEDLPKTLGVAFGGVVVDVSVSVVFGTGTSAEAVLARNNKKIRMSFIVMTLKAVAYTPKKRLYREGLEPSAVR